MAGPKAADALFDAGCVTVLGEADLLGGKGAVDAGEPATDIDPDLSSDAVVLFTSGTTGTPKAVPLAQGLIGSRIAAYAPAADPVPAVSLMCVPFVHVGGMLGLMVALARGSTTVALTRFDAGEWLDAVERYRVNTCFLVPNHAAPNPRAPHPRTTAT